jgi:DNA invertase Pin-like site-specific DNA recombinase
MIFKQKAVALCRVSTSKQRIFGNSLDAQETRIIKAAELLEVLLSDDHIWRKDISSRKGKNLNRKDVKEIFAACKQDKSIKYFIVDEPDRFMRSIEEFYWWKVEFKRIGVRLVFAHKPLVNDDDQNHIFDELIDVYRAESSNQERSRKANDKMQSRIDLGYYPGYCHTGYVKSDTKGIHVAIEPQFSLLQEAYRDVASGKKNLREALEWLASAGFRLKNGKKLDMNSFKRILKEPYYYGAVKMGNFTQNEKGLHRAMVSKEEFDVASRIAKGQKARFTVNRHNPEFPMNGLLCEECFIEQDNLSGKFTGYEHHNGKKEGSRKYYKRYRCRSCGKAFKQDELHKRIADYLAPVRLTPEAKEELVGSLRRAWSEIEQDSLADITRLRTRLAQANEQKLRLIMSLADNPELKADMQEAIALKKEEISIIEDELLKAQDIETDFTEFVEFSLSFVDNLKANWWTLDYEDRLRCEQLLFPQLLRVNEKRKVSTPEITAIYRYKVSKKTPVSALNAISGGRYRNKFTPMLQELLRWRTIIPGTY